MRREAGDILPKEPDRALRRQEIPGDAVEQRRLSGAVGAQDRASLPRAYRERDVGQGR